MCTVGKVNPLKVAIEGATILEGILEAKFNMIGLDKSKKPQ
jgi:hypothetical protein